MIQRYIQSDYTRIMEIWESSVKVSYNISKDNYVNMYNEIQTNLPKLDLYVYRKTGKIIAFMGIDNNSIELLHCDPEYMRQGIGTFMVNHAVEFLNVKYVDIYEDNKEEVEFYKSLGFIVEAYMPHEKFGYNVIHLKLEKGKII